MPTDPKAAPAAAHDALNARQAAAARDAVRTAQTGIAQAIGAIVALGADAPTTMREPLHHLGLAFAALGYSDPNTPWSVPSEEQGA